MIKVYIERNVAQQMIGFSIIGHAAYAKKEDIVCAGVSAISQTAFLGLQHYLSIPFEVKVDNGDMRLKLPELSIVELEAAQVILTTMLLGLKSLQQGYPRNIQVLDAM